MSGSFKNWSLFASAFLPVVLFPVSAGNPDDIASEGEKLAVRAIAEAFKGLTVPEFMGPAASPFMPNVVKNIPEATIQIDNEEKTGSLYKCGSGECVIAANAINVSIGKGQQVLYRQAGQNATITASNGFKAECALAANNEQSSICQQFSEAFNKLSTQSGLVHEAWTITKEWSSVISELASPFSYDFETTGTLGAMSEKPMSSAEAKGLSAAVGLQYFFGKTIFPHAVKVEGGGERITATFANRGFFLSIAADNATLTGSANLLNGNEAVPDRMIRAAVSLTKGDPSECTASVIGGHIGEDSSVFCKAFARSKQRLDELLKRSLPLASLWRNAFSTQTAAAN